MAANPQNNTSRITLPWLQLLQMARGQTNRHLHRTSKSASAKPDINPFQDHYSAVHSDLQINGYSRHICKHSYINSGTNQEQQEQHTMRLQTHNHHHELKPISKFYKEEQSHEHLPKTPNQYLIKFMLPFDFHHSLNITIPGC